MADPAARTFQGKLTHASKLLKWLENWDGSPISIAEVQGQLGMTPGQWKEARKNAAVKEAFKYIESYGSGKNCKIKRSENTIQFVPSHYATRKERGMCQALQKSTTKMALASGLPLRAAVMSVTEKKALQGLESTGRLVGAACRAGSPESCL